LSGIGMCQSRSFFSEINSYQDPHCVCKYTFFEKTIMAIKTTELSIFEKK